MDSNPQPKERSQQETETSVFPAASLDGGKTDIRASETPATTSEMPTVTADTASRLLSDGLWSGSGPPATADTAKDSTAFTSDSITASTTTGPADTRLTTESGTKQFDEPIIFGEPSPTGAISDFLKTMYRGGDTDPKVTDVPTGAKLEARSFEVPQGTEAATQFKNLYEKAVPSAGAEIKTESVKEEIRRKIIESAGGEGEPAKFYKSTADLSEAMVVAKGDAREVPNGSFSASEPRTDGGVTERSLVPPTDTSRGSYDLDMVTGRVEPKTGANLVAGSAAILPSVELHDPEPQIGKIVAGETPLAAEIAKTRTTVSPGAIEPKTVGEHMLGQESLNRATPSDESLYKKPSTSSLSVEKAMPSNPLSQPSFEHAPATTSITNYGSANRLPIESEIRRQMQSGPSALELQKLKSTVGQGETAISRVEVGGGLAAPSAEKDLSFGKSVIPGSNLIEKNSGITAESIGSGSFPNVRSTEGLPSVPINKMINYENTPSNRAEIPQLTKGSTGYSDAELAKIMKQGATDFGAAGANSVNLQRGWETQEAIVAKSASSFSGGEDIVRLKKELASQQDGIRSGATASEFKSVFEGESALRKLEAGSSGLPTDKFGGADSYGTPKMTQDGVQKAIGASRTQSALEGAHGGINSMSTSESIIKTKLDDYYGGPKSHERIFEAGTGDVSAVKKDLIASGLGENSRILKDIEGARLNGTSGSGEAIRKFAEESLKGGPDRSIVNEQMVKNDSVFAPDKTGIDRSMTPGGVGSTKLENAAQTSPANTLKSGGAAAADTLQSHQQNLGDGQKLAKTASGVESIQDRGGQTPSSDVTSPSGTARSPMDASPPATPQRDVPTSTPTETRDRGTGSVQETSTPTSTYGRDREPNLDTGRGPSAAPDADGPRDFPTPATETGSAPIQRDAVPSVPASERAERTDSPVGYQPPVSTETGAGIVPGVNTVRPTGSLLRNTAGSPSEVQPVATASSASALAGNLNPNGSSNPAAGSGPEVRVTQAGATRAGQPLTSPDAVKSAATTKVPVDAVNASGDIAAAGTGRTGARIIGTGASNVEGSQLTTTGAGPKATVADLGTGKAGDGTTIGIGKQTAGDPVGRAVEVGMTGRRVLDPLTGKLVVDVQGTATTKVPFDASGKPISISGTAGSSAFFPGDAIVRGANVSAGIGHVRMPGQVVGTSVDGQVVKDGSVVGNVQATRILGDAVRNPFGTTSATGDGRSIKLANGQVVKVGDTSRYMTGVELALVLGLAGIARIHGRGHRIEGKTWSIARRGKEYVIFVDGRKAPYRIGRSVGQGLVLKGNFRLDGRLSSNSNDASAVKMSTINMDRISRISRELGKNSRADQLGGKFERGLKSAGQTFKVGTHSALRLSEVYNTSRGRYPGGVELAMLMSLTGFGKLSAMDVNPVKGEKLDLLTMSASERSRYLTMRAGSLPLSAGQFGFQPDQVASQAGGDAFGDDDDEFQNRLEAFLSKFGEQSLLAQIDAEADLDSDEEFIEAADTDEDENELSIPTVMIRPKMIIGPGHTLESIAEKHFDDGDLAWLIADLNRNVMTETFVNGKRVVEFRSRQEIELPVWEDVELFYRLRKKGQNASNLVTVVVERQIDREVVENALGRVMGS